MTVIGLSSISDLESFMVKGVVIGGVVTEGVPMGSVGGFFGGPGGPGGPI